MEIKQSMSSSEVQVPSLAHFTPFTQPTQFYTELHCTCFGSLVQKPIKEYAEVVSRSGEAAGSIKKGQEAAESVRKGAEASGICWKL